MARDDDDDRDLRGSWVEDQSYGWRSSSGGLGIFANALRGKLMVTVLFYCLALLAIALKSPGFAHAVRITGPALGVILGLAMIVGIVRFTHFPLHIGGRVLAFVSLGLVLVSVVADGYAALLAMASAGVRIPPAVSFNGVFAASWRLPWAISVSQIATLLALAVLVLAFRSLGKSVTANEIVHRSTTAAGFLGIATAFALQLQYVGFRGLLRPDALAAAGLVVLGVSLLAVAKALGVTRFVQAYLRGLVERETGVPVSISAWRNA